MCDCPENFTKCPSNLKCLPSSDFEKFCPQPSNTTIIQKCPDDFPISCRGNKICRKSQSDCPSMLACPIGYFLCSNNQCKANLTDCPKISSDCSKILCPYDLQTCVHDLADCPTGKTCLGKSNVVCPDGKCVENEGLCSAPPPDFFIQGVSCGGNQALCEDNICRESCLKVSKTLDTTYFTKFIKCPQGQMKCQDNSCRNGIQECLNFSCSAYQVSIIYIIYIYISLVFFFFF